MSAAAISPEQLATLLEQPSPHALLDVRERAAFERGHIYRATPLPRRLIELRLPALVTAPGTLIVLYDDDGSLSALAAATLGEMGYTEVFVLAGGIEAWRRAGQPVVQGLNVPSKVFGERVLHEFKTPEVTCLELSAQMAAGRDMVIVDTRTPEEYSRGCLPGAWSMPGGELVLRIGELVKSPEQTIVVHCGGRTRSYLGAESLRRMGLPNPIVAVKNGTMGWQLDGLELERGATRWPPAPSDRSRARAIEIATRVAAEDGIPLVSADAGGVRRRARARLELGAGRPGGAGHRRQHGGARGLAGPDLRRLRPLGDDRGLAQAHGLPPRGGAGGRRARVGPLGAPARVRRADRHALRLRRGPPRGRAGAARACRGRGGAERGPERRLRPRARARRPVDRAGPARAPHRGRGARHARRGARHLRGRRAVHARRRDAPAHGLRRRPRAGRRARGLEGGRASGGDRNRHHARRDRRRGAKALRARARRDGGLPPLGRGARPARGESARAAAPAMTAFGQDPLVSTAWLAAHLAEPDLKVVDATFYLPHLKRDARAEFEQAHLPGAVPFDIETISDHANPLPHMLPDPRAFADAVGALGIGTGDRVVAYGGRGLIASARVWWTFRVFGHERVAVLDGGSAKWKQEGRPVESGVPAPTPRRFAATLHKDLVADLDRVLATLERRDAQIIDARSRGRFAATEPEIRPGLRGGHIPGSLNLPYNELFSPDDDLLRPEADVRGAFQGAGLDLARPVVATCGSGVSAAVL